MRYVLGLDGGGTKTACLVADAKGRIVGRGFGGPGNYLKAGLYVVKTSLRRAVQQALRQAGIPYHQVAVLCAGLAGVDRRSDKFLLRKVIREVIPIQRVIVESDAYIALMGATGGRAGMIVISGTGSIAMGINRRGERARAGGWGHVLGDEGSGYDIARKGLVAALKAYDRRGKRTLIEEKIKRKLELPRIDEIIPLFYQQGVTPARVASFYPLVQEAADQGDKVARSLMVDAAQDLAETTFAVAKRLGMQREKFSIALIGSIFENNAYLVRAYKKQIKRLIPAITVKEPLYSPERGAVLIALGYLKGDLTASFTDKRIIIPRR